MNKPPACGRAGAWFALAVLLAALPPAGAVTNDFSTTTRYIRGARVNLKPLVDWLKASLAGGTPDTDRPLTAWKVLRLEGVGKTNGDWAVTAEVDGKKENILLRNPPRRELAEFSQLKALHGQLTVWTNQIQQALRRVEAGRKQAAAEEASLRRRTFKLGTIAAAQARVNYLANQSDALNQDLEAARQRLQAVEAKGYDFEKPFTFDCLALETGEKSGNKMVLDRGQAP
jgi:hypothetical protein